MARYGVTQSEVAEAAMAIQARGENPTIARIRETLGTGSSDTIARHLKAWKAQQGEAVPLKHIPPALASTITGLWESLQSQANERVEAIKKEGKATQEAAESLLSKTQQTLSNREAELKALKAEHLKQQKRCSDLSATVDQFQRKELQWTEKQNGLEQRLQSQQDENQRVHQALLHTQRNLEHYQAATQQQREKEQLEWDKQRASYEQQVQALRVENVRHQQDQKILEQENQAYIERDKQQQDEQRKLEETLKRVQEALAESKAAVQAWQKQFKGLNNEYAQQNKEAKEQIKVYAKLSVQYDLEREKNERLEHQVASLESRYQKLSEEHAFLSGQLKAQGGKGDKQRHPEKELTQASESVR